MMGNVPGWLIGPAWLAMVALMCLPMTVGMIRGRGRRGAGAAAGSPAAEQAGLRPDRDSPDTAGGGLG